MTTDGARRRRCPAGVYGKPHPAVIAQTNALPVEHASVVCQMTCDGDAAPDFRVVIEPTARHGLRTRSRAMAGIALSFIMGLAD